jgi:hypothetical protein
MPTSASKPTSYAKRDNGRNRGIKGGIGNIQGEVQGTRLPSDPQNRFKARNPIARMVIGIHPGMGDLKPPIQAVKFEQKRNGDPKKARVFVEIGGGWHQNGSIPGQNSRLYSQKRRELKASKGPFGK